MRFRSSIWPLLFILVSNYTYADETYIGMSSADMTPPLPIALGGQLHMRIADHVETPLTASVLVIERREGNESKDAAIWVAAELVVIPVELIADVRKRITVMIPGIESRKVIINATHTHTGPELRTNKYILPDSVTSIDNARAFIAEAIAGAIKKAWESRTRGSMTWGLGYAKIAVNRRATYYDGSAVMYGKTNLPEFKGLEGPEDHEMNVLFFWDEKGKLLGTSINVACPAQEVESGNAVNADFWHPVRKMLEKELGSDMVVLGWIGAAGDQSPHLMYGREADRRMRSLRNMTRLEELARRIVDEVTSIYGAVKEDRHPDVMLNHSVRTLQLPRRLVTIDAYDEAKKAIEELKSHDQEFILKNYRRIKWHEGIMDRYHAQEKNPNEPYPSEIHLVRLGDVAICTNPFELFTEFGVRMKARNKAIQTFIIQLAGPGTYLPTMHAVKGGSYSAIIQSNEVGPEAGDILVEETVRGLDNFWTESDVGN